MWKIGEEIGDKEGRMDVCVAAAGISHTGPSLEYSGKDFNNVSKNSRHSVSRVSTHIMNQVMSVNLNGTLFAAQAAGRQMVRFGTNGSIIMIASMCGSIALEAGCRS